MAPAITSDRSTRDMGDSNEVLNRMFSSFLTRKNRGTSSAEPLPRLSLNLPRLNVPVRQPSINHPVSAPAPTIRNRDRSKTSSSRQPPRTSSRANGDEHHHDSIAPARTSQESIQAIATDTTTVPTPFHCDRCTKAFRQRSQLSRHYSRVHEKRKPFACAHCSKAFASAFDRKRHVEAVHGRRCIEFFCDRCAFKCVDRAGLEAHVRTVHERDCCRVCGKVFKRAANLVAHERHYHSRS